MGSIVHAVDPIDEISAILTNRGGAEYGDECVTQRAQALQGAQLAERLEPTRRRSPRRWSTISVISSISFAIW